MARPRGKKRTAAQAATDESSKQEAAVKKRAPGRPKRARSSTEPSAETEYFPEKRNLVRMLQDGLSHMVISLC